MTQVTPSDMEEEHRGLLLLASPRSAYSRITSRSYARLLPSTMAVANVDTRHRTIEGGCRIVCLSVCLSVFISIHPTFLACYGNHLPTHASSHCRYFLLIRSVIKVSSIALAIRFVITALFTRQACKSTTSDSVSRTGLLESRQTSARSKSGDTALVKMQRCSRAAKSLINLTILAGARAQVMEKGSTPVIPPL